MKLRHAFNLAKTIEITWYPQRYNSSQMKISKVSAKKNIKPMYDDYLGIDGDDHGGDLLWYDDGGTIIASYYLNTETLVLGV